MQPLRWGIVGAGRVASSFVAALSEVSGGVLGAVASRDPERARALARSAGREVRVHDSYETLVADPSVDAVYVATPAHLHRAHCLLALEARKPVLCEKPFALDAVQAREIVSAARAGGIFCMEAMWMRFTPACRELQKWVRDGRIGRPLSMMASVGFHYRRDSADRLFDPARGGGALLDLGVYPISLAVSLLGRPERVTGQLALGPTGVDEQATALLEFGGGARASIAASLVSRLGNDAVVSGDAAMVRIGEPLYCPEVLILTQAGPISLAPATRLRRSVRARLPGWARRLAATLRTRTTWRPVRGNGMRYQIEEVQRCLAGGERESPLMPLDESVATLEVVDAVRSSARGVG
ncbi:MAG TPA: Gfo/Idh/MocA family oxidoreductase [Myxococcaceae bacterium]|nr:Gfo/Idh/MocA family oxidoreductase [Myxococcaceae bacterium]